MEEKDKDLKYKIKNLPKPISLKKYDLEKRVISFLIAEIQKIPEYLDLKLDVGLLQFACCIVESTIRNKYSKKGRKYDKLEIVTSAYERLYSTLSKDDRECIKKNVEYLHSSKMIKKVHRIRAMYNRVSKMVLFFLRK